MVLGSAWGSTEAWFACAIALAAIGLMATVLLFRRSLVLLRDQSALRETLARLGGGLDRLSPGGGAWETLLDRHADLLVRCDAQGRILFANQAYADLIGRRRPDLIGAPPPRATLPATLRNRPDGSRQVEE